MSTATMTSTTTMTLADLKAQEKAAKKAEKERQKRIDADEKAERKRAAKTGFSNPANPTRSMALTIVCAIFAVYCLFPFVYLMINATKTQSDFTSTFGLGFGKNVRPVRQHRHGVHLSGRYLRPLVRQHDSVCGGRRRRCHLAGHHGRLCAGQVPLPRP